jgi:hypothetical protein
VYFLSQNLAEDINTEGNNFMKSSLSHCVHLQGRRVGQTFNSQEQANRVSSRKLGLDIGPEESGLRRRVAFSDNIDSLAYIAISPPECRSKSGHINSKQIV